jgi:hypothetical protein
MAQDVSEAPSRELPVERPTWEPPRRIEVDLARRHRAATVDDRAADARDAEAATADAAANVRDLAALQRDVDANMEMSLEPWTAAARRAERDREAAAVDRIHAADHRSRAQRDRTAAKQGRRRASDDRTAAMEGVAYLRDLLDEAEADAEDLLVVGRAQGMLMQHHDVGAAESLLEVAMRAARNRKNLQSAALDIITEDID